MNRTDPSQNDGAWTNTGKSDSEQIKRRIDHTRGAMDETLDELSQRLSPRNLVDDLLDIFRSPKTQESAKRAGDAASSFAQNLGRQVRDNPVPSLLVGAGLTWLALSGRDRESEEYDRDEERRSVPRGRRLFDEDYLIGMNDTFEDDIPEESDRVILQETSYEEPQGLYVPETFGDEEEGESAANRARHAAASASRRVRDTASRTGAGISSAASTVGEKVSEAASATKDSAKSTAHLLGSAFSSASERTHDGARRRARDTRNRARSAYRGAESQSRRLYRTSADQVANAYAETATTFRDAHRDYPLGVGLGFLALGALAGLAIPRTRQEDEWMGEHSDQMIADAQQTGEQALARGKESIAETVATAKQAAEAHGLTPDSLAERANTAVKKVASSASDAAKEEGLHPTQLSEDAKEVAEATTAKAKEEAESLTTEAKEQTDTATPTHSPTNTPSTSSDLQRRDAGL